MEGTQEGGFEPQRGLGEESPRPQMGLRPAESGPVTLGPPIKMDPRGPLRGLSSPEVGKDVLRWRRLGESHSTEEEPRGDTAGHGGEQQGPRL